MDKEVHQNISVDCVIFGFDFEKLNVILVERHLEDQNSGKKLISDYTLTGNQVYVEEPLEEAAKRVLFNLTGLQDIFLEQFYTAGDPNRLKNPVDQLWLERIGKSPEERVLSICYFSVLNCTQTTLIKRKKCCMASYS